MCQSTTTSVSCRATPRASLAALGVHLRRIDLFGPIRDQVHIAQKTILYSPQDKLYDAFVTLLTGAQGLVDTNSHLRADRALQAAFGRTGCAEQSVIQETLNACTETTVKQMEQAMDQIFRMHSLAYRHDYAREWQVLDVDMTGLPCGPKAALATPGYFAKQRGRRGRQLGRVFATRHGEVVVDRVFDGSTQLTRSLQPLMMAAETTLELDETRRQRTVVRMDAGGGSIDDVNWVLNRGYHFHGKAFQHRHVARLAGSVSHWQDDPHIEGRQFGWVTCELSEYVRPLTAIAVRRCKKNGHWDVQVVLSTLTAADVLELTGQDPALVTDQTTVALAYVAFYDQRGGGIETAIKGDKQGLGLTKRNKKRFAAQQMVVYLGTLAHNVILWAQRWLAPYVPQVRRFGLKRMVRDAFGIMGRVDVDDHGRITHILLNQADRLARHLVLGIQALLVAEDLTVSLGET